MKLPLSGHVIIGTFAVLTANSVAQASPAWREAFQSSPASYEAPSKELLDMAEAQKSVPVEQAKALMTSVPVSGTVRYRVVIQANGGEVRVRFSNEEGAAPLHLAGGSVGLAADAFSARPGTLQKLTFGGQSAATIPAGAPLLSDPVKIAVAPGTPLLISASLASPMTNFGRGGAGFLVAPGDQVLNEKLNESKDIMGRPLVSGVSVLSDSSPRVIITFGDSITDGNRPKVGDQHGWPEQLARRLAAAKGKGSYTVVNAGIGGNRLLAPGWGQAGLARLDRDALRIEGVSHLIVLEGTNDIGMSGKSIFGNNPEITAAEIIAGYRQVIARAHVRDIKVYIGTLTPTSGAMTHSSPAKDAVRDEVNRWIRTSGESDAVIDFDLMVRDQQDPRRFRAEYDSGDHLHPNAAGYIAMGNGIDLALFDNK